MNRARPRAVLIEAFCDPQTVHYLGYSRKAVEKKIEDRVWRFKKEFDRAPDGHIMIILDGVDAWAENQKAAA